jgi:hypothetical protein
MKPLKSHEHPSILVLALTLSPEQQRVKELLETELSWSTYDSIQQVAAANDGQLQALVYGVNEYADPVRGLFQYELAQLICAGEEPFMNEADALVFARGLSEEELFVCAECVARGESPEEAIAHHRRQRQIDRLEQVFMVGDSRLADATKKVVAANRLQAAEA